MKVEVYNGETTTYVTIALDYRSANVLEPREVRELLCELRRCDAALVAAGKLEPAELPAERGEEG